jgi:transmembrane sensor
MNTTSGEADFERIEDEASVWAARLRGGAMTDADRAALAKWLDGNPEHRAVLARYRELSAELDVGFGGADVAAELAAQRRRWRRFTVITAAAAAIVAGVFVWSGRPDGFETKLAERHLAALADGSRVELNARTSLSVAFSRSERHVKMSRGEALFSVAKDPARPFVIETPAGTVRVTGTVFDVRAVEAERVEVTVLEGTVRVQPAKTPARDEALTPGRQAVLRADDVNVSTLTDAAVQNVTAWREGQVAFDDTPLSDALQRFAAYHARAVTVDPAVSDLRLGGRFALDDLDGLLGELQRVLPVRVIKGDQGAVRIVAAPPAAR